VGAELFLERDLLNRSGGRYGDLIMVRDTQRLGKGVKGIRELFLSPFTCYHNSRVRFGRYLFRVE